MAAASEYWSLDIPGLTEDQAVSLREGLEGKFDSGVIVSNPRHFMVRGFDRASVEILATCLRAGLTAGGMSVADMAGAESMLYDCEQWLSQAEV